MDLTELATRTGILVRRLRYVLDHRILPGLRDTPPAPGVARTLTEFEAFGVALAARMLAAGLTRSLTAAALAVACRELRARGGRPGAPLLVAYTAAGGELEVADGTYVRVRVPRAPGVSGPLDTGWVAANGTAPPLPDYVPQVRTTVELGGLAATVRGNRPGYAGW